MKVEIELSLQNIGALYNILTEEKNEAAVERLLRFVDANSWRFIDNEELFNQLPYQLILDISSRNSFPVKEVDLFCAIHRWHQNNPCHSNEDVYKNIRWNLMKAEEFAAKVLDTNVIPMQDYFASFSDPKPERTCLTLSMLAEADGDDYRVDSYISTSDGEGCSSEVQILRSTLPQVQTQESQRIITDEEVHLINLALHLCQSETFTLNCNGERSVECVLKMIKRRVTDLNFDYILMECLNTLKILLSKNNLLHSSNCDSFFSERGDLCLLDCFQAFMGNGYTLPNNDLLLDLLQIIKGLTEVEQRTFRAQMYSVDMVEKLTNLLVDSSVSFVVKYFAVTILLTFADSDYFEGSTEAFDFGFLPAVKEAVDTWTLNENFSLEYIGLIHMEKVLKMIKRNGIGVLRLYFLWLMAYGTSQDAEIYCQVTTKEEIKDILKRTKTEQAKKLTAVIMKNYRTLEQKNKAEQSGKNKRRKVDDANSEPDEPEPGPSSEPD